MPSVNDRLQHLQSQIDGLRNRIQHVEKTPIQEVEQETIEGQPQKKTWYEKTNLGLVTLFTFLLFASSMLQWQAARDAINDTHKSFEIGTRAWVVLKEVEIKPTKPDTPFILQENGVVHQHGIVQEGRGLKDSHGPAISAVFINAGHSPAMNLLQNSRIEVIDKLPTGNFVMPPPDIPNDKPASKLVIAPDTTFGVNQAMLLTDEQLANIKSGKQFLAVYGDITYEDIFKEKHETKYCVYYETNIEKMVACPEHNSVT